MKNLRTLLALMVGLFFVAGTSPAQQPAATVRAIAPPASPLPLEAESARVTKFSFIAYGDTRSAVDGTALQPDHSALVSTMLTTIQKLRTSDYPARFILQSGDGVTNGLVVQQWNTSFVDVVSRITKEANVPYFLIPGNHDVCGLNLNCIPAIRQEGLKNYFNLMAQIIPPDGSPRRLSGYPTFSIGYGNTFVLGIDSDISSDDKQFNWVKSQLEGLDRKRYVNVIAYMHHGPFTSGLHRVADMETLGVRVRYMPLFRTHHVAAVIGGHDHEFEHFVEHYTNAGKEHRMDLIVSAGGGAPQYGYTGEPNTADYLAAGAAEKVRLDHIVKPSPVAAENKFHFLIVRVNGSKLSVEVVGTGPASTYRPYGKDVFELRD